MKSKTKRNLQKEKFHSIIRNYAFDLKNFINKKIRAKGRIKIANRWAKNNPRQFFVSFLSVMAMIILINVSLYIFRKHNRERLIDESIFKTQLIVSRQRIDENNEKIKNQYHALLQEGLILTNQLDSISKLKVRTHTDTIEMTRIIAQLNVISKLLKYEEN